MQKTWAHDAIFYHIYPLGFCDAPQRNDHHSLTESRLTKINIWIPHLREMGVNAVYLGPVFESSTHGYDTADYYLVDRRLGTNETLARLVNDFHNHGIRVILDGVFNHVGRSFWAFQDVMRNHEQSRYCDWFQGLRFGQTNPLHDPFTYDTWQGHHELVKLNLFNPETRQHLLEAVRMWIQDFGIDGLRLDTADCLDLNFQKELSVFTRNLRPDFWLLGEVIHGDYRHWIGPDLLQSVTNYECYKGLYSSHADKNFHEIAYALNRQFGDAGIYRDFPIYNFADNHDVDRVASKLENPAHLYTLYSLLFTMPGVPSIYYGSEWGLSGTRSATSDQALRPGLNLESLQKSSPHPHLLPAIQNLARIRHSSAALRHGSYHQLSVASQQLAFARQMAGEIAIVQINAADQAANFDLRLTLADHTRLTDLLNPGETFTIQQNRLANHVQPNWARILVGKIN